MEGSGERDTLLFLKELGKFGAPGVQAGEQRGAGKEVGEE